MHYLGRNPGFSSEECPVIAYANKWNCSPVFWFQRLFLGEEEKKNNTVTLILLCSEATKEQVLVNIHFIGEEVEMLRDEIDKCFSELHVFMKCLGILL